MSVALKLNVRSRKPDKDGMCPILMSIRGNGDEKWHSTGIKVHPDNFIDGQITANVRNHDILNGKLRALLQSTERQILNTELQGDRVTVALVKQWLDPQETKSDLLAFAAKLIAQKADSTRRRYTFELDKLKDYTGGKLKFNQVTPRWLDEYYKHLRKTVTHNTTINAFKVIRHVFNVAKAKPYPFTEWTYPQADKSKSKYLTLAECDRLYDLLFVDDIGAGAKTVCAFFLLECFAGIRFSDWSRFRVERIAHNDDMLLYTQKTDTPIAIPIDLMPSLRKVVDYIQDNGLKFTKDVAYANTLLQEVIMPKAKITQHMTTHLARHTFATMMLSKGVSRDAIAAMMGITLKQVHTYAHFDNTMIRKEMARVGGV